MVSSIASDQTISSVRIADLSFEKWQAAGNDFILVAMQSSACLRTVMKQLLRHYVCLCVRDGTGIGADGIIVFCEHRQQIMVWIINADGSFAQNCGNGLRCAAQYYFLRQTFTANNGDASAKLISIGNRKMHCARIKLDGHELIATNMGKARLDRQLDWFGELEQLATSVGAKLGLQLQTHACELGNRHAVFFSAAAAKYMQELGERLQAFADGINVHCVWEHGVWENEACYAARSYERGVGITHACGSGAGAIAALLADKSATSKWVRIRMLGGLLFARKLSDAVVVAGQAKYIYSGTIRPLSGLGAAEADIG